MTSLSSLFPLVCTPSAGVHCDASGNVVNLILSGQGLTGEIPDAIADYPELTVIDLSSNDLTSMTSKLGTLSKLVSLNLGGNRISGSIPESFEGLKSLQTLYLYENQLIGPIPSFITQLPLKYIDLQENLFTGDVTAFNDAFSVLYDNGNDAFLRRNCLQDSSSTLPKYFGTQRVSNCPASCQGAKHINNLCTPGATPATNSCFYTTTDDSTGNVCDVATVFGPSVPTFTVLSELLDYIFAADCNSEIPGVYCDKGEIYALLLSGRGLTGEIPSSINRFKGLITLDISMNDITGSIPTSIGDLSMLQILYIYENRISGPIPTQVGKLQSLVRFYAYQNEITGSVPVELGSIQSLLEIDFDLNFLTGDTVALEEFFERVANAASNSYFLRDNCLQYSGSGKLPTWFTRQGHCPASCTGNLAHQDLCIPGTTPAVNSCFYTTTNESTGNVCDFATISGPSFPDSKVLSVVLEYIFAADCQFEIRGVHCNKGEVYSLLLSGMELTGPIPLWVAERFPGLITLDISDNFITGPLPRTIGDFKILTHLYLYHNKLDGHIPEEIARLPVAEHIYLYENQLTGPIPHTIASMSSLIDLDLQENFLTGDIKDLHATYVKLSSTAASSRFLGRNCLQNSVDSPLPIWFGTQGHCPSSCANTGAHNVNSLCRPQHPTLESCFFTTSLEISEDACDVATHEMDVTSTASSEMTERPEPTCTDDDDVSTATTDAPVPPPTLPPVTTRHTRTHNTERPEPTDTDDVITTTTNILVGSAHAHSMAGALIMGAAVVVCIF
ncbi:hypothetical protein HDU98_008962 [Podochytrium sp. JEL0797]|nr:hypothetical protein HDU98_008962 [Podochytrium sp. JEL0797]